MNMCRMRLTRAALWLAASWLSVLVIPELSSASTVSLRPRPVTPGAVPYYPDFMVLHFEGAPGERNVVSVRLSQASGYDTWTITDTGAAVIAAEPCRASDPHTVVCEDPRHRIVSAEFELGDLDDRLVTDSRGTVEPEGLVHADGGPGDDELVGYTAFNTLDGGPGNDSLIGGSYPTETNFLNGGAGDDSLRAAADMNLLDGGPGDDRLVGNSGADELDGGGGRDEIFGKGGSDRMTDGDQPGAVGDRAPGPDLMVGGSHGGAGIYAGHHGDAVSYAGRKRAVSVDLASGQTGGEAGEGDVLRGIETVVGGSGDDRLRGDDRANTLAGGGGRDLLVGRGAGDSLWPGTGGGPIMCGAGNDVVEPSGYADRLDVDCEHLDGVEALVSRLPAHPRPGGPTGLRFRVRCPDEEDPGPAVVPRCVGDMQVREAGGRRRLLARGSFAPRRSTTRVVDLLLTPLGKRLASRRPGVWSAVRLAYRRPRRYWPPKSTALRWSIRLKLTGKSE